MWCTKRGYNKSVIFSLFAKSNARSNGILGREEREKGQTMSWRRESFIHYLFNVSNCLLSQKTMEAGFNIPYALEMHGPNLHNVAHFFALENTISSTTSHPGNVQELGAIDHVIICAERVSQIWFHDRVCNQFSDSETRHQAVSAPPCILTLSTSDTNPSCLHLKAQAPFIFPQRSSHSGLHPGRRMLSCGVIAVVLAGHRWLTGRNSWQR